MTLVNCLVKSFRGETFVKWYENTGKGAVQLYLRSLEKSTEEKSSDVMGWKTCWEKNWALLNASRCEVNCLQNSGKSLMAGAVQSMCTWGNKGGEVK